MQQFGWSAADVHTTACHKIATAATGARLTADAEGFEEEEDEETQSEGEDGGGERQAAAGGEAAASEEDAEAREPLADASVRQLTHHSDAVMVVAWSPDGQRVVTGGCDDKAFICDWRPGAPHDARTRTAVRSPRRFPCCLHSCIRVCRCGLLRRHRFERLGSSQA